MVGSGVSYDSLKYEFPDLYIRSEPDFRTAISDCMAAQRVQDDLYSFWTSIFIIIKKSKKMFFRFFRDFFGQILDFSSLFYR